MYLLSGILGGISILASLFLILELGGASWAGSESSALAHGRVPLLALIAAVSGVASMTFHRRANRSPNRPPARLILAEGISFTLVGVVLLVGGFVWLRWSGGFLGLHLIGFLLGGVSTSIGLRRLITKS